MWQKLGKFKCFPKLALKGRILSGIKDKKHSWQNHMVKNITGEENTDKECVFCVISSLFSHHHTAKAIWCLSVCSVVSFAVAISTNAKLVLEMIKWLNSNQQTTQPVYQNCLAQQLKRVCKTRTDCLLHIKCVLKGLSCAFFLVLCLFWFGFHCCFVILFVYSWVLVYNKSLIHHHKQWWLLVKICHNTWNEILDGCPINRISKMTEENNIYAWQLCDLAMQTMEHGIWYIIKKNLYLVTITQLLVDESSKKRTPSKCCSFPDK